MSTTYVWTGEEIVQLRRFSTLLNLANQLIGHEDYLANLLLEDALEELNGVLGERARPVSPSPARDQRRPSRPQRKGSPPYSGSR